MNSAQLVGRVGQVNHFKGDDKDIMKLSVATSESYLKDNEWQEKTEWHNVVQFSKFPTKAAKGDLVAVEGSLRTTQYEKGGVQCYSTQIVAKKIKVLQRAVAPVPETIAEPVGDGLPF